MGTRRPPVLWVYFVSSILVVCALLAFSGTHALSARADSPSFVRVIHASPFVGEADVFLDGKKLLSSFAFGAITDYAAIPPGPHRVQIALVGKGIGASAINEVLAVKPGVAYTVAAVGATATTLALKVFIDDNTVTAGSVKVRVYQLSPDAGSVSVTYGTNAIVSDIGYEQVSPYRVIPAGTYTFDITAANAGALPGLPAKLNANTVMSIFAVGLAQGTPPLETVPAEVKGLPGLPGTGSDPNAPIVDASAGPLPLAWLPWTLGALALILLGSNVIVYRRIVIR